MQKTSFVSRLSFGISLALFCLFPAGESFAEPIVVGRTKQLFFDDAVIESKNNLQRVIHPARKHPANPILLADSSWEDHRCLLYGSVLRENDQFRMWYYVTLAEQPDENREPTTGVAYAESSDGIHWKKPELDFVTLGGQKTNVLFERDLPHRAGHPLPYFTELLGVQKHPHENRYLMGFLSVRRRYDGPSADPFHRGQRRGFGVATSPDGLKWQIENSFTTDAICDGDTHWMFDRQHNRHVLYGRTKHRSEKLMKAWAQQDTTHGDWVEKNYWGRVVARTESPDLLKWKHTGPAAAPIVMSADEDDEPGTEIYSMLVFPYESIYVGLVQVFHNQPDQSYLDLQLAVSRDTVHFERVGNRETFLPCGGIGDWDRFNNSIATNPPIRVGNDLRFYYSGRSYRHGPYEGDDTGVLRAGIGVASIPIDRFVSIAGSYNRAQMTTKPILLQNKHLYLNLQSQFGKVVVEILDQGGQVLAKSLPIQTDSLRHEVAWEAGNNSMATGPVRLRFSLENSHLFAFWSE